MNEALLRLDLEIARAAATLLDEIDMESVQKDLCFPGTRTIQELQRLRVEVRAILERTEAAFASYGIPLPGPERKKLSWDSTSMPLEG